MKKLIMTAAMAAVLTVPAVAQNATPNPFAYKLQATQGKSEISFYLNAPAENVIFRLFDAETGEEILKEDLGAGVKGENTKTFTRVDAAIGDYKWSIEAVGKDITAPVLVAHNPNYDLNDKNEGFAGLHAINSNCIAIDNNPTSPYFGNIYLVSAAARGKTGAGARTATGIYILDACFKDVEADGVPFTGNVDWASNSKSSPYKATVAPNGDVYICDWSDVHSGVWVMDPAKPSGDWRKVFEGERNSNGLVKNGDVQIHGSIPALFVTGTGEETTLYTLDEDYVSNVNSIAWTMLKYNLGTTTEPWDKAPTAEYAIDTKVLKHSDQGIAYDGHGGAWISQHDPEDAESPSYAIHVNLETGEIDYYDEKEIFKEPNMMGKIATSHDGRYVVVANCNHNVIAEVEYDENGTPRVVDHYDFYSVNNNGVLDSDQRPFDVAFDAANNYYVTYNNNNKWGGVFVYALPKEAGENKYETNAVSTEEAPNLFAVTQDTTSVETIVAEETKGAKEYFDLTGRKVAAPQKGTFYIVRQGNKAEKVIY